MFHTLAAVPQCRALLNIAALRADYTVACSLVPKEPRINERSSSSEAGIKTRSKETFNTLSVLITTWIRFSVIVDRNDSSNPVKRHSCFF